MRTAYKIDEFQPNYFVLDSLDQLIDGLVGLDFGPVYTAYRDAEPLPAGVLQPGEQALALSGETIA
jgi:phenylalanine-4-hydroxylase